MPDAMSSVEIEDVLSSIRRLVSEELRPAPRSVPAEGAVPQPAVEATPAPPAPAADDKLMLTPALRVVPQAQVAPPPPLLLPRLHLGVETVARVVASTLERKVAAQSSEWESEVGDPPLLFNDMQWTEDGWLPPSAQVVQFAPTVGDGAASWAQVEPELAEPDPVQPTPIAEPDPQWADQAEAEVVAQLQAPPEVAPELQLDEQALRDLVRTLILEELQGSLGERITRNVRKLVRAEIARTISVHGVE